MFDQIKIINQIMIINILQNMSHTYYSNHMIIKCVDFELIHYVIDFDVTSIKFDYVFLSNVLLV